MIVSKKGTIFPEAKEYMSQYKWWYTLPYKFFRITGAGYFARNLRVGNEYGIQFNMRYCHPITWVYMLTKVLAKMGWHMITQLIIMFTYLYCDIKTLFKKRNWTLPNLVMNASVFKNKFVKGPLRTPQENSNLYGMCEEV